MRGAHGIDGDVENRSLAPFLSVVNPAYHRHELVNGYLVCQSVLAVEAHSLRIVAEEELLGVDQRVVFAK